MKVYLDTLGCRLNQSEIESMARQFRAAGYEIVASAEQADLAVMNTCAVTSDATSDSRRKIRRMAQAGAKQIVATGCWATLQPKEAAALPNVKRVVPNDKKDFLVAETLNLRSSTREPSNLEPFNLEPLNRIPLPGLHHRTRAFIKAQDGCDNHCTFCVTTVARGEGRSHLLADVLNDIQFALDGGTKEIVLTGVHLGSWGQDLNVLPSPSSAASPPPKAYRLYDLVKAILRETDVPRLRLSSLEPWDLDADFFSLWEDPRLCRHLHLPLQSGCAATLKRMARKTTPESFRDLTAAARSIVPDAAITTDVIAGFPGETESEFAESLDFVRAMNFAGGHAFPFSPRPGTAAMRLAGQLRPEIRKERSAKLREALKESAKSYRQKFIGQTLSVLWESSTQLSDAGWEMEGWSENYLRIKTTAPCPLWNEISRVKLNAVEQDVISSALTF